MPVVRAEDTSTYQDRIMNFNVILSEEDVRIINTALSELPLKVSLRTFTNLNQQLQEQSLQKTIPPVPNTKENGDDEK